MDNKELVKRVERLEKDNHILIETMNNVLEKLSEYGSSYLDGGHMFDVKDEFRYKKSCNDEED